MAPTKWAINPVLDHRIGARTIRHPAMDRIYSRAVVRPGAWLPSIGPHPACGVPSG
jgi:hypothetical protein